MKKNKKTIRTSPTINRGFYDAVALYNMRMGTYIERMIARDILGNDFDNEVMNEIEMTKTKINFYKDVQRLIDKRIKEESEKLEEIESNLENKIVDIITDRIKNAHEELMSLVTVERKKRDKGRINGVRYNPKPIPIDTVISVCDKYKVTPKMVLPLIHENVLVHYFENYGRYV